MSTDISLQQAVEAFTVKLPPQKHMEAQEALKLARWYGEGQPAASLRPIDIEHYVETFGLNSPLARGRADSLKAFLNFADKASMTSSRLVSHVRVRKPAGSRNAAAKTIDEDQGVRMTSAGKAALEAELEELISTRPQIAEELRLARLDGDYSENAPLDAARESQGKLEGRIRELEAKLNLAVIVENDDSASAGDVVRIGSKIVISELTTGTRRELQIVNASEAQGAGRLSHDSPVGRAIVGHRIGDVVTVTAPRGKIEYRIDGVNA
ncbi:MAG: transcription elongation factor GreA [Dehalococcoidia bacterium]